MSTYRVMFETPGGLTATYTVAALSRQEAIREARWNADIELGTDACVTRVVAGVRDRYANSEEFGDAVRDDRLTGDR